MLEGVCRCWIGRTRRLRMDSWSLRVVVVPGNRCDRSFQHLPVTSSGCPKTTYSCTNRTIRWSEQPSVCMQVPTRLDCSHRSSRLLRIHLRIGRTFIRIRRHRSFLCSYRTWVLHHTRASHLHRLVDFTTKSRPPGGSPVICERYRT